MLFWTLRCFATVGGEILQNWSAAPVKQQMERSSLKHGGHFEMHKLELWNYLGTFKTSWSPPHPTPHPPNWKQTCLCKGMGVFFFFFGQTLLILARHKCMQFLEYRVLLNVITWWLMITLIEFLVKSSLRGPSAWVWLKGVPGPWGPCSQRPVADKPWRPWTGRVLDATVILGDFKEGRIRVGKPMENPWQIHGKYMVFGASSVKILTTLHVFVL